MAKKALITGITGQDGSYMAELLLDKGYEVFGMVRRSSTDTMERIRDFKDKLTIVDGDLADQTSLNAVIKQVEPDEVYHLAAMSFVPLSWTEPIFTSDITGIGTTRVLDAIRFFGKKTTKMFHPTSSEIFGLAHESPQNEKTMLRPRNPYGIAKTYAYLTAINYREYYKMFVCNAISYNHESPKRGLEFVSRKITDGVAKIKAGLTNHITLGSLDAQRDWGFAGDFVEAYHAMMQQETADDYVIATGELHTVQEMVEVAFGAAGIKDWKKHIKTDPRFIRPPDARPLVGDITKVKARLKWKPKTSFKELITAMVEADLKRYGVR